jgi:peptidoglycan hydrolase-like protein with peptidoglycan-binding domain
MPKSIKGSVGLGGTNLRADVATVQYLLNCVPAGQGGPAPELAVDGLVGPKTIAAIRKFQTTSFGSADGRADPGGRTIQTLQAYDPYPTQAMAPSGPGGKGPAGSSGKGAPGKSDPWGKTGGGTPWGKYPPGKGDAGGKFGY